MEPFDIVGWTERARQRIKQAEREFSTTMEAVERTLAARQRKKIFKQWPASIGDQ